MPNKKEDLLKLKDMLSKISDDKPIAYDDEDRANGLHDPNNDEEVEAFFANAKIIKSGKTT